MSQFEAVIFDWAGTTVDFGCMAPVQAFVEGFKKFGITPTMEEVREPMGMLVGSTTGYTDKMMEIVVPIAKEQGYEPDCWFSPDSTNQKGRPYPYMIFKNMEKLGLSDVRKVMKIGDTTSDIKEGKNAGVVSAGVIVGSSEMGLTKAEYEALSEEERKGKCEAVAEKFRQAGADYVFMDLKEAVEFVLGK